MCAVIPAAPAAPLGGAESRCLHLFSGRASRADGLSGLLREAGWTVRDKDIANTHGDDRAPRDLADGAVWEEAFASLSNGQCDFLCLGTP
eukprot:15341012-Alexandrium_andersonii.AAC.1